MEGDYEGLVRETRELKRYVRWLARPRYPADDLFQDTYLQAFKTLEGREIPENLAGWLKRVAQWTAWRRIGEEERYVPLEAHEANGIQSVRKNAAADLVREEESNYLQEAINTLTDREQRILHDYYWDNLSCAQIAQELESTRDAVKVGLYRARRKLRAQLR